ncbi:MAG: MFS transporter [Candidatus Omnitrophica bacterium]|nr:MFS transporter [Candidatus Omnitrophota bacterium]
MFSSLKVKTFRFYWLGMFISLVGTWVQSVAQSWLMFELTQSAFLLGLVVFLSSIPIFALSLFGGVLADRMNKKKILLITQNIFMFLAFLLAILTQAKLITPEHIMIIALANGIVMAFDAPARQSMVAELVGRQYLLNAIALNSAAFNSARIIGPALAGILIAAIGMSGCFYINGVSFLAVIIALLVINLNNKNNRKKAPENFFIKDLSEGLKFIKDNRTILLLILMVGVISLFGISYVILMPVFANEVLGAGVKGLASLMSSAGAGALAGALILARLGDFKHKGKLLVVSSLVFSVSLMLFSLSKVYLFSVIMLIFIGWASITATGLINTLLQTLAPDELRGRAMSAFMLTFAGFMPFGNLLAGALAHTFGVSVAVFFGGAACLIFFTALNLLYPSIKDI